MSLSTVHHALHPSYAAAALEVCYHGVASLTFLVWHCLLTLDDEVQYVWAMRNKNQFKWLYFFLRYVVILAHVIHNILIRYLANGSNPPTLCRVWNIYVLVLSQTLATSLELILASRVFALYNRSRSIGFLLLIVILLEGAGTVRMLWLHHLSTFHETCLLIRLTVDAGYQSTLGFIVHCMFISLTWFKYFFALKAGWGRTPLVSLVVRDGSTVYIAIVSLLVSVAILCGLQNERGIAMIFWSSSLISISGCRMILGMERLAKREIFAEARQPFFTSEIGITWSAQFS